MASAPNRRGAALSVVTHVTILIWLASQPPLCGFNGDPMESLIVEVVEPETPPPPPAEPAPEASRPAEAPAAPERPAATPHRASPTAAKPTLRIAAPAGPAATAGDGEAFAVPPTPRQDGPSRAPAQDKDELPAFAERLWQHIAAHPPTARKFRGVTLVTFSVGDDGALLSAAITESSGSGVHDRAALDALAEAVPFPRPPTGIAPARLTFTIPFEFR